MVPATTAVGWDTKAVIAGKKEAERLDMCRKDGNHMERNPKIPKTQRLVAWCISWMNWIAYGWP